MIYLVLMTELKATTNQKLRIHDTIATRTNSSNFFPHGIQLLEDRHRLWVPTFLIYFWSELHAAIIPRPFLFAWTLFSFFFSWMYDLGVWARMTGSSKAQGQGDTYHFSWLFFSWLFSGRPF